MWNRYRNWTLKQASSAQCSPALGVLFLAIGLAVVVMVYRSVIITTLKVALLSAVVVACIIALTALTVNTVRYYRARARLAATEAAPVPDTWTKSEPAIATTLEDEKAITQEADWLAASGDGVELAFSPDGKALVRVKDPAE